MDSIIAVHHHNYYYSKVDSSTIFTILEMNDWVLIIPKLNNGEFVIIKQFRAGTNSVVYEFPGGGINKEEEPLKAAKRELEEECGLVSDKVTLIGTIDPNPAFMTNKCHIFIAEDCLKIKETKFDKFEDIESIDVSYAEINEMIRLGNFTHSISLAGFSLYLTNNG